MPVLHGMEVLIKIDYFGRRDKSKSKENQNASAKLN
jgi:hypothetical protein